MLDCVELLPHRPPLVMIRDGEDLAEGEAAARAVTSSENYCFDPEIGGVPAAAALEFMAQTMALAVGLRRRRAGLPPAVGYVLGSRRLTVGVPVFRSDGDYRITAKCEFSDEEYGSFVCRIVDANGREVAVGTLTAYQPPALN